MSADDGAELDSPIVSEKGFMNLSDRLEFGFSIPKLGQLTIGVDFEASVQNFFFSDIIDRCSRI